MLELKVKKLSPHAIVPRRATDGSAGYDLYAPLDMVKFRGIGIVNTGIAIEIPDGYVGLVLPRSRISKAGVHTHTGVIDSDYRGSIGVRFTDSCEYTFDPGDRIAQLLVVPCMMVPVVEVDELSETARGTGGFGSTGR